MEQVQEIGYAGYDSQSAEALLFKGKLGSFEALLNANVVIFVKSTVIVINSLLPNTCLPGRNKNWNNLSCLSSDGLQSRPQRTEQACRCSCVCVCVMVARTLSSLSCNCMYMWLYSRQSHYLFLCCKG